MTPRYFQGQEVTGKVFASTAKTFREVVEKLNVCPQIPLTRKAFLALPEKERNAAKHVPYFVPAVFKESPCKRTYENALHCNLIFLDIDPEKEYREGQWVETGRCPAAPFVADPELLYTALKGFNFAAHLTASSTPEKPRMRILVDANEIPLSLYPAAVKTIANLLGLPSVTKESKVAVQCMFLPSLFQDDTEEQHPLLAHTYDDKVFEKEDITDCPAAHNELVNGSNGSRVSSDGLEFLRAPLPEITLEMAKDALSCISPDCSYHEWLDVAASLKHQFAHICEEDAYALFDSWSAEGTKYVSEDETRAKWNSLRPTPIGREPKTIRSLLRMATQAGWDDTRVKEKGYASLVAWMDTTDSITTLMEEGVRRIVSTPQISATQEGMLLDQLRVHAKERFAYRASITDLRKDLARLREKMQVQKPDEEKKKTPKWAKGLCFVSVPKEFYRPLTGEKYKPDSFNMKYARHLLPTPKQLIAAGTPVTEATLSTPTVHPDAYVLNYLQIPCFFDYAYNPAQPNEMLFVYDKKKYVNTYSPSYPESDFARAEEAGAYFQQHLTNLVAEPEYRRILTDFMAFQVQFPGQKVRWAVLIQGAEGAGKTYLCQVMKAVLGQRNVKLADGTTINSGWNEWTVGYQMVFIEEVRVVGTNRHDIMNRLKPWITNEDIPINEKFRSSRDAQNITNYMLFSNYHDCLALTPGDRRYFVIKSPLQSKAQVLALGKDYFKNLFGFLNTHPGAVRAYLLNWKISDDFSPHAQAPRTRYVEDMINDSANPVVAAVRHFLLEGDHPLVQYDIVSSHALLGQLNGEQGLHKVNAQQLAAILREEGYQQLGRHLFGDERHYIWIRPGVNASTVLDVCNDRIQKNVRNLHMELLF